MLNLYHWPFILNLLIWWLKTGWLALTSVIISMFCTLWRELVGFLDLLHIIHSGWLTTKLWRCTLKSTSFYSYSSIIIGEHRQFCWNQWESMSHNVGHHCFNAWDMTPMKIITSASHQKKKNSAYIWRLSGHWMCNLSFIVLLLPHCFSWALASGSILMQWGWVTV